MSGIDERRKAIDAKLAHDSELKFKVTMLRDKLLGQWAGEQLQLTGDALDDYVKSVVHSDFEEPGDQDIIRKVTKDLADNSTGLSQDDVASKLEALMAVAHDQLAQS